MTTPTSIPTPAPAVTTVPQVEPSVVETAAKLVRAKTFVKKTFARVGLPVLIGVSAAYVATRNTRCSEDDPESFEIIDTTEE